MLQLFLPFFLNDAGDALEKNCQLNQANWAKLVEKYGKISAGEIVLREYGFIVPKQPNHFSTQYDLNSWFDGLRRRNSGGPRVLPRRMPTARLAQPSTPVHCNTATSGSQKPSNRRKSSS